MSDQTTNVPKMVVLLKTYNATEFTEVVGAFSMLCGHVSGTLRETSETSSILSCHSVVTLPWVCLIFVTIIFGLKKTLAIKCVISQVSA